MLRDHQLLVRGDYPCGHRAVGCADPRSPALVGLGVEVKTQPLALLADARPNRDGMLADTAREHHGVETPEGGGQGAELASDAVNEHIDGRPRAASAGSEEVAHVAAEP